MSLTKEQEVEKYSEKNLDEVSAMFFLLLATFYMLYKLHNFGATVAIFLINFIVAKVFSINNYAYYKNNKNLYAILSLISFLEILKRII